MRSKSGRPTLRITTADGRKLFLHSRYEPEEEARRVKLSEAAVVGACVIEKHIMLDKTLPGRDHAASLEPDEFAELVSAIRKVEEALGAGRKVPHPPEEAVRDVVRKSIVAEVELEKSTSTTGNRTYEIGHWL